ncbi:uncharacterized protein LOC143865539 isoform X2 [Tasmannia lanceolata]|uniref:uncharacterized protein LOC143865539 isoform X2 n=1 Tax=Tasmannia lanceolata TaxID=3420 RepID=UPI004063322A
MPTVSRIALENLVEPTVERNSLPLKQETNRDNAGNKSKKKPSHIYFSPALYITPKSTPIPHCPDSVSPSPYLVNRKLREVPAPDEIQDEENGGTVNLMGDAFSAVPFLEEEEEEEDDDDDKDGSLSDVEIIEGSGERLVNEGVLDGDEIDEEGSLNHSAWKNSSLTTHGEYYDAPEEFFSDGSSSLASPSSISNLDAELRGARINLFEEIERRKKAEKALYDMHRHRQRIVEHLSQVGLSFPVASNAENMQLEIESAERLCLEVAVTRFVSEAVGRGQARAEAEAAAEAIIDSKNHEIGRLRDKLQYREAVNHEMSQRNQKIIEISRQQHQRRKMRHRWIWSSVGMSIAVGASVLAYSYLPHTGGDPLLTSNECSEAPSDMLESCKAAT